MIQYLNIESFKVISAYPNNPVFNAEETLVLPNLDPVDKIGTRNFILETCNKYKPTRFFVDTFPFGILGELPIAALQKFCECIYIARFLKEQPYRSKWNSEGRFDKAYVLDFLSEEQEVFLTNRCSAVQSVALPNKKELVSLPADFPTQYWLVNHSGGLEEVQALIAYAKEIAEMEEENPVVVVNSVFVAVDSSENLYSSAIYPATGLYAGADKIFTGAGYHSMIETEAYQEKHFYLPFNRKYDDQYRRAALRKAKMQGACKN